MEEIIVNQPQNIAQSNIDDSLLASELKLAIAEYCDIIVNTPIFVDNQNKDGIKELLKDFFNDLYVTEPSDVLNYVGQKPSNKLLTSIFTRYGIESEYIKEYPELLKSKTAYLLNSLVESKGSIKTYEYLNNILSEFYKDINFYKVVIDLKTKGNRYDNAFVLFQYFGSSLNNPIEKPSYLTENGIRLSPSAIYDTDIELKFFINYNMQTNNIEYDIRLFDPQPHDIFLKFNTMKITDNPILIPKGETKVIYKQLAFDTSAIKEYEKAKAISVYYNNASYYDMQNEADLNGKKDITIQYTISALIYDPVVSTDPELNDPNYNVQYIIDFGKKHPFEIKIALDKTSVLNKTNNTWDYNYEILKMGETKIVTGKIALTLEELEFEANGNQQSRSEDDLIYRLEPLLINDPNNILNEVNSGDLFSRKFLMNKIDFFDQDVNNAFKKNVFPVTTNLIHIQLGSSVVIDNTKMHPDIVRMYGMTYLNNGHVMKFNINNNIFKLNIQDYVDVLSFLKYKQIELTTGKRFVNENIPSHFYQYKLPPNKLKEIYDLHLYYQNMPQSHKYLKEFKFRFNELLFSENQKYIPKIKNMEDFVLYLKGNAPETLDQLFIKINEEFLPGKVFIDGIDQNQKLLEIIFKIQNNYELKTIDEFIDILSTIEITDSQTVVSVYDMIRSKFNIKYPRMVALIEAIDNVDDIIEIYLYNYKVALEYASKMDNLVEYFINDIYQLYIQSTVFTKRFFNPVIELFEQYFFKAEQVYKSEQNLSEVVRDKTNVVTNDDNASILVSKDKVYSIIFKRDKQAISILCEQINNNGQKLEIEDNFKIEVFKPNSEVGQEPILKSSYIQDKNNVGNWVDII